MKKNSKLLEVIKKGGSASSEAVPIMDIEEIITYQLRLPRGLINRIDFLCQKKKPQYYSRHAFVMDAIMAKLEREEK